jgi:hypothetical protein
MRMRIHIPYAFTYHTPEYCSLSNIVITFAIMRVSISSYYAPFEE